MSGSHEVGDTAWNKITIDQTTLFVKYMFTSKSYNIKITDLVFIYEENLEEAAIQDRFCLLNPYAEMNSKRILDNIKLCLEQNVSFSKHEDSSISISTRTDDNINLKLKFIVAHISLFWEFHMLCSHPHQMFVHVVQPMMYIANDREKRCQDLIKIIQEKDKEIEEHRAGGSKALKETEIFNQEQFFSKDIGARLEINADMQYLMRVYEDLYNVMLTQKKRTAFKTQLAEADSTDCKPDKTDILVEEEVSPVPLKKLKSEDPEPLEENKQLAENESASEKTDEKSSPVQHQHLDVKIKKKKKPIKF